MKIWSINVQLSKNMWAQDICQSPETNNNKALLLCFQTESVSPGKSLKITDPQAHRRPTDSEPVWVWQHPINKWIWGLSFQHMSEGDTWKPNQHLSFCASFTHLLTNLFVHLFISNKASCSTTWPWTHVVEGCSPTSNLIASISPKYGGYKHALPSLVNVLLRSNPRLHSIQASTLPNDLYPKKAFMFYKWRGDSPWPLGFPTIREPHACLSSWTFQLGWCLAWRVRVLHWPYWKTHVVCG